MSPLKRRIVSLPLVGPFVARSRATTNLARTAMYVWHFARGGMWRSFLLKLYKRGPSHAFQSVPRYEAPGLKLRSAEDLRRLLLSSGIHFHEGDHAFYLPPQPATAQLFGSSLAIYPPNVGLKILTDLESPENSTYLGANDLPVRRLFMGSSTDFLYKANYLYALGIGPRVWDVCCLQAENAALTAFVVDHVEGTVPSSAQCEAFKAQLKSIMASSHLRVAAPNWESTKDFSCPDCHGNLIISLRDSKPYYVDFQNFALTDRWAWTRSVEQKAKQAFHFGGGRLLHGSSYLYQSNPVLSSHGKRDTRARWERIAALVDAAGIRLEDRLVLDVGCNAGFMMNAALCNGASWALGWDRPQVAAYASELQLSLGMSRFHMFGADLHANYDLAGDIPSHLQPHLENSVVFYLSVHRHIGFVESLAQMPWRLLVFEGHQGEAVADLKEKINAWLGCTTRIVGEGSWGDGDSLPRALIAVTRD